MEELHGIGISAGRALGRIWHKHKQILTIPEKTVPEERIPLELERLKQAMACAREQLESLRHASSHLGEAFDSIIDFHQMALMDEELIAQTKRYMDTEHCGVECAFQRTVEEYESLMLASDSEYMRGRSADIRDIGMRVMKLLLDIGEDEDPMTLGEPVILLAEELAPSDAARLNPRWVAGVVIRGGSPTSHTAILAKALEIPAIVAVSEEIADIPDGVEALMDGGTGLLVIQPEASILQQFVPAAARGISAEEHGVNCRVATCDGVSIELQGNIELPVEAVNLKRKYDVDIGLFRTEFLFVERGRMLDEEEQYEIYSSTVKAVEPNCVTFRTLDVGGDKFISEFGLPQEMNPFLGTRAIRFSLMRRDVFRVQLRALLRVSALGHIRIMFPMISTVGELLRAKACLSEVMDELRAEGIPFDEHVAVGCMIEVPSAAIMADALINYVDFFSIGTNDLVQYCLAVDRGNAAVAYLYQPAHPAVLRLILHVIESAEHACKPVSLCGEMAGDVRLTALLLGLGIRHLSMSPGNLVAVRDAIVRLNMQDAIKLAEQVLTCERSQDVEALLEKHRI